MRFFVPFSPIVSPGTDSQKGLSRKAFCFKIAGNLHFSGKTILSLESDDIANSWIHEAYHAQFARKRQQEFFFQF